LTSIAEAINIIPMPRLSLTFALAIIIASASTAIADPLPVAMRGDWCLDGGNVRFDHKGNAIGGMGFYERRSACSSDTVTIGRTGYERIGRKCRFLDLQRTTEFERPGDRVPIMRGKARCQDANGERWLERFELSHSADTLTLTTRER
jgi:hypothetical protein